MEKCGRSDRRDLAQCPERRSAREGPHSKGRGLPSGLLQTQRASDGALVRNHPQCPERRSAREGPHSKGRGLPSGLLQTQRASDGALVRNHPRCAQSKPTTLQPCALRLPARLHRRKPGCWPARRARWSAHTCLRVAHCCCDMHCCALLLSIRCVIIWSKLGAC